MTAEQFPRAKALFAELEALPASERVRALAACDDAAVRDEVGQLLSLDGTAHRRLADV